VLRDHALVIGEVTLSSGKTAGYYVDARRALLRPDAFTALGELVTVEAKRLGAAAVGGPTLGADPIACSVLAGSGDGSLKAFSYARNASNTGCSGGSKGPPSRQASAPWWSRMS
jgi:orotate phosphoribosyltransferase